MQNLSVRDGKLLTEEQLAKALETSVYNVRHLRHRKKIPFIRLGHRSNQAQFYVSCPALVGRCN
jgi:hypothetical protein